MLQDVYLQLLGVECKQTSRNKLLDGFPVTCTKLSTASAGIQQCCWKAKSLGEYSALNLMAFAHLHSSNRKLILKKTEHLICKFSKN